MALLLVSASFRALVLFQSSAACQTIVLAAIFKGREIFPAVVDLELLAESERAPLLGKRRRPNGFLAGN